MNLDRLCRQSDSTDVVGYRVVKSNEETASLGNLDDKIQKFLDRTNRIIEYLTFAKSSGRADDK